jgi:8-oxo-dGTP pyrophosphatase MutT (NUDIX family)
MEKHIFNRSYKVSKYYFSLICTCFMSNKLDTAGLLVIKDNKLLLAYSNNKQCFYLPGGKVDNGETAEKALCREIAEELKVQLDEAELEFYTHISAPAYGEKAGIIMEQDCFLIRHQIHPIAAAEIGELRYFSLREYLLQPNTAPGAIMILQQLTAAGLISN